MIHAEQDNVRFFISRNEPRITRDDDARKPFWVFSAERVSDGHRLPGQIVTETDITDRTDELVTAWFDEFGALAAEPPATLCYACNEPLVSDSDTDYQFDNALWVTLEGGYGMFVESESFMLISEFWRSLTVECQYAAKVEWLRTECDCSDPDDTEITGVVGCPTPLPASLHDEWEAWFATHRRDRVVICHDCAHAACDALPWLARLIDPHRSHAHRTSYIEAHADHSGWDYDKEKS